MQNATVQKLPGSEYASIARELVLAESLDCLRTAITIFDSEERLVYANQHYNYLLRSLPAREELVGVSYRDLIRLEAEGELDARHCANLDLYIASRRAQFVQGVYKPLDVHLADGRILEIKARPTRTEGWILLWTDVTRERHMFSRLEAALALSADAFAFFDADDRLALANAQYVDLGGHETLEGKTFAEILKATVRNKQFMMEDEIAWAAKRLEAHRSAAGAMTLEKADGTAWLLRDRPTPDGGRVAVMTDVTDTRRIEKAFAEQKETLARTKDQVRMQASYLADLTKKLDAASAEADNTKTTLLRTMSHELKTPLNAIIGFSDLLSSMSDRFKPEQVKEYADLIHSGGNNLLRLINSILDLTKIAAGRYELHRRMVDAGSVAWNVKGNYAAMASGKQITIQADEAPVGILVFADEMAFETMVTQLVDNAVRFTQAGGLVRLAVQKSTESVKLTVSDNGPGVEPVDMRRILQPFEQAGRAITEHTAGAGLGLTLVRAFAELHGGALTLSSAPGQGFTVTLELPAADT